MLDLDDFRIVNEAFGREGGDEVLRHWAAALTVQLRSCDLVCRYGADEFLLVLLETADQQADAALERVLAAMRELSIDIAGKSVTLTASAGVASYPEDGRTAEELVAKAADHHVRGAGRRQGPHRVLLAFPAVVSRRVAARIDILSVGALHRHFEPVARHYTDLLRPWRA